MRSVLYTLIPNPDMKKKKTRPISLINIDGSSFTKTLANRIQCYRKISIYQDQAEFGMCKFGSIFENKCNVAYQQTKEEIAYDHTN